MKAPAAAALALAVAALHACAGARVEVRAVPEGVLFRYRGPADAVTVAGTMSAWAPMALSRDEGGFAARLPLAPGRYEYRLEVTRGEVVTIELPERAERADDGFGGENAVVRVP